MKLLPECTDTQDWKCPQKATIASSHSCIDSQAHGRAWIKNSSIDHNNIIANNERGIALMLTVFVVTIASILVTSLAYRSQFDLRYSRKFAETIQADYVLKSCLALSVALIETPKEPGVVADWPGEIWSQFAALPEIPIFDSNVKARLQIVDDRSKINVNAIASATATGSGQQKTDLWKSALSQVFANSGNFQAQKVANPFQTIGDNFYDGDQQVAVIHDWLDRDSTSHQGASYFTIPGIESSANKAWFYNRPLHTLEEMLLIPGMTKEKLLKVAPYIKVPTPNRVNDTFININTASSVVLSTMAIPPNLAEELTEQAKENPHTADTIAAVQSQVGLSDDSLADMLKASSNQFSAYANVRTPNGTRWLFAQISTGEPTAGGKRKAEVQSYSIR